MGNQDACYAPHKARAEDAGTAPVAREWAPRFVRLCAVLVDTVILYILMFIISLMTPPDGSDRGHKPGWQEMGAILGFMLFLTVVIRV